MSKNPKLPRHARTRGTRKRATTSTPRISVLRSQHTHWKSTTNAPPSRPRLTAEDVQKLATLMRERFRWEHDPKDFQLEAVRAQIEGVDMIVRAPTGSGKTAIAAGPHLWPGNENKFTIMVCPLLSLEEEMV